MVRSCQGLSFSVPPSTLGSTVDVALCSVVTGVRSSEPVGAGRAGQFVAH
jgi:hypothetical protein